MKAVACILSVFCVIVCCVSIVPRPSYAYECGKTESAELRVFIEHIISESNKLEKCIKARSSSDKKKASCRLFQMALNSLYISVQAMYDMVSVGCYAVKCNSFDKVLLAKIFEGHNMMIGGVGYKLDELSALFEADGENYMAGVCRGIRSRVNAITLECNVFYGTIFERMGEEPPPSP